MATKKTTKKTTKKPAAKTAKKSAVKTTSKTASSRKKTVAKKATTTAGRKKAAPQQTKASSAPQSTNMLFVYAVLAAVVCYAFASWAIDSGNLWFYAAAFAGFYLTVSYTWSFLRSVFNNR